MGKVHKIEVVPVAASRPRGRICKRKGTKGDKPGDYFIVMYTDGKYDKYKDGLTKLLVKLHDELIPKGVPVELRLRFKFPFPKSTPKKLLVEGQWMITKPDWDNLAKAVQDAMTSAHLFHDDNQVCRAIVEKQRTLKKPCVIFQYKKLEFKTHDQ